MTKTASDLKGEDYIDSRDIIAAALELRVEITYGEDDLTLDDSCGDGMAEYVDGANMIREDRFEDYARELAKDIGAINRADRIIQTLDRMEGR